MKRLTKRRYDIYVWIVDYFEKHGYAPSYREIADGVGLKSVSSVFSYIKSLMNEGYLVSDIHLKEEHREEKNLPPRGFRVNGHKILRDGIVKDTLGDGVQQTVQQAIQEENDEN